MGHSGSYREAVPERDRRTSLQASDLDHPRGSGKVERERGSEVRERLVGCVSTLVALHAVVDLNEIHPACQRSVCDQSVDAGESRLIPIQPGKDRPGVQANAHRGSRARSLSRRVAIPVFENRPPKRAAERRATSTISSFRSSKSTVSPGCRWARSRNGFGITTCPFAPIRPVIPHKYNVGHRRLGRAPIEERA